LINWPVNFSSTTMKKTYWKYKQAQSWDEDTTNDYLQEIWKISSPEEIASMLSHLSKESNKKALLWPLKDKVISEMQSASWWFLGIGKDEEKKKILSDYAERLWVPWATLAAWWWIKKEKDK
jgi:hypothetical protein